MKEFQKNEEMIYELIIEDLDQTISANDKIILKEWRSADQENEKTYQEFLLVQNSIDKLYGVDGNADASWNALAQKINDQEMIEDPKVRRFSLGMILKIAAVFLLILSVGFFFLSQDKYAIVSIPEDASVAQVILPDATIVNLNSGTKIKYNKEDFLANKTIEVLEGEVFVQVVKHDGAQLRVLVGDVEAQDIGTSFNVTKNEDDVNIIVEEGAVAMKHVNDDGNVLISAGKIGSYDSKTRQMNVALNTNHNYKSWLNKYFTFNSVSLSEVAAQLEKVYQIPVVVEGKALNEKKFTINKLHYQTIDSALSVISASLQFRVTKQRGAYVLSDN
ncbi:MAG: FecR family protein [Pedobacter sp.]|nr:MAG: FecR family protein [Pedobacter sp.]